jgi:hypothetical protein
MLIATQQLRSTTGNFQHNYNRVAVTTRSTVAVSMPTVVTSAASSGGDDGIVAAANVKQEPGIAGEVTLNR